MPDYFYVYPGYLSDGASRREGRRVPAPLAVKEVSAEEILEAAKKLGYTAELQSAKQYPRQFYTYAGRVKVMKREGTKKTAVLRSLVAEIRRTRPAGASPHKGAHR